MLKPDLHFTTLCCWSINPCSSITVPPEPQCHPQVAIWHHRDPHPHASASTQKPKFATKIKYAPTYTQSIPINLETPSFSQVPPPTSQIENIMYDNK